MNAYKPEHYFAMIERLKRDYEEQDFIAGMKKPRTSGEDAKPNDDETRGDDEPDVRGNAHSARR